MPNAQWGSAKYPPGKLTISGIRSNHSRSRHNVWLANFVEQVVGVDEIRRLALDIDQAVEDVAAWPETRSGHVGMDAASERMRGGALWAA
ncbi:hypothetical protein Acr_04g0008390 [Actinidia rufa]|uniref:Uncharacterized protein n=1 Tax=Actinidia rufa TaxID=165716 RepID=A0A7J0EI10_9ERIC|nr:hypothetical protein Acr_04g0008390 [Actinidia rufa]